MQVSRGSLYGGGGERVSYHSMWVLTLPVLYVCLKLYVYVDDTVRCCIHQAILVLYLCRRVRLSSVFVVTNTTAERA